MGIDQMPNFKTVDTNKQTNKQTPRQAKCIFRFNRNKFFSFSWILVLVSHLPFVPSHIC